MSHAHASVSPQPRVNATNQPFEGTVMTITTEILDSIERACPVAPIWTLTRYIGEIREGMAHASAEVSAHATALLLKLEHLAAEQRVPLAISPAAPRLVAAEFNPAQTSPAFAGRAAA